MLLPILSLALFTYQGQPPTGDPFYYVYGRVHLTESTPQRVEIKIRVQHREKTPTGKSGWTLSKPVEPDENQLYCVRVPKGWDARLSFVLPRYHAKPIIVSDPNNWRVRAEDSELVPNNDARTEDQALRTLSELGNDILTDEDAGNQLFNVEAMLEEGRLEGERYLARAATAYKATDQYKRLIEAKGADEEAQTFRSALALLSGSMKDLPAQRALRLLDVAHGHAPLGSVSFAVRSSAIEAWSLLPKAPATEHFLRDLSIVAKDPTNPLAQSSLLALARAQPADAIVRLFGTWKWPAIQASAMDYIDRTLDVSKAASTDRQAVVNAVLAVKNAPIPKKYPLLDAIARQDPETSPYGPEIVRLAQGPRGGGVPLDGDTAWSLVKLVMAAGKLEPDLKIQAKALDETHDEWLSFVAEPGNSYQRVAYRGNPKNGYLQIYVPAPPGSKPTEGGIDVQGANEMVVRMRSDQATRIGVAIMGSNEDGPVFQPSIGPLTRQFQDYFIDLRSADPESLSQLHVVAQFNFKGSTDRTLDIQSIYFRRTKAVR